MSPWWLYRDDERSGYPCQAYRAYENKLKATGWIDYVPGWGCWHTLQGNLSRTQKWLAAVQPHRGPDKDKVVKELLDTLKREKLVLDWRKRQQTRAAVLITI